MKKVLVTGASGFLGHTLVEKMAKLGIYEIIAVISGRRTVSFPDKVQVEAVDLMDQNACRKLMERVKPDIMLHYAWTLGNHQSSEENIKWLETCLHLGRLFVHCGGKTFLFAGTYYEYGTRLIKYAEGISRDAELSLYGSCKLAFEQAGKSFFDLNGVRFITARYVSIYGPGMSRRAPIFNAIETMLQGNSFYIKNPYNIWDYIYIDDAAEATIRLLNSDYCGTMNIASGTSIAVRRAFSEIANLLNRPDLICFDEEPTEYAVISADTSRMESVLHYRCTTPLREGLARTIRWYQSMIGQEP